MFEGLNKSLVLPYALGENFTMADILLYPWFERWSVLKVLGKKIDPKYERLLEWIKNIQARDSIKQTRQTDEFYYGNYKDYF
jgi:glutathione S-transferase